MLKIPVSEHSPETGILNLQPGFSNAIQIPLFFDINFSCEPGL